MSNKKVLLAAPRGYCAGVDRAVVTVEKALQVHGAPIYVRKQIVHNKHVVETLEEKGVIFVEEISEVPEGSIVVFSAHGVSPLVHQQAAERDLKTIDATCPLVTKVHNEAKRFAKDDYQIVLIGHEGHEEVEKLAINPNKKIAWLSQTTLSVDETLDTVYALKQKLPELIDPPSDDICYATQNRQEAIKTIAPQADLVIVVGSKNSSNSVRLVEVALEYGAKASYLVDYAEEIQDEWFKDVETIGLTSGASVPEILVTDVLKTLAEHGYGDVETITAMEESLLFALPPELRKDMKAAGI